ncbi:BTB/POZ domain-containing protein [Rhynchospora pubera]|uniref:BTB/POZ domain-containing protein n=1 Tax=Rhynchospora pubera TaxID=906938 RepID=A0AAV8DMZ1_9POAL|nr:BTB/POZ domain-containing protein [Rhynchospora pubera]
METEQRRVEVNVGGRHFETTTQTLPVLPTTTFLDRDPSLFSDLLSLLRSPSSSSSSTTSPISNPSRLIQEASHYGLPIQSRLRSALSPPPLLGFDASLSTTLLPASDPFATALSAAPDGSLCLAHAGVISSYDSALAYSRSLRTHLDRITSLSRLPRFLSHDSPLPVAVAGSLDHPGLHLYDLSKGAHLGTVFWSDPSDTRLYKAWVAAIAPPSSASSPLFAAFEAAHRENCILCVDPTTLQVTGEIGRQSGIAAKSAAPNRVVHLPELGGLVFMSSVSAGAFGYSGYMRLWDPRSGDPVWETSEPGGRSRNCSRFGDSFADVDADGEQLALYKVCWKSGDVGVADLRKLSDDPWIYLSDSDAAAGAGGGVSGIVHCYKGQVFVGRQSGVEVWSQLDKAEPESVGGGRWRRNWMDGEEEAKKGFVRQMEAGGDRLFLRRQGLDGVQVWQTSRSSRLVSLLCPSSS